MATLPRRPKGLRKRPRIRANPLLAGHFRALGREYARNWTLGVGADSPQTFAIIGNPLAGLVLEFARKADPRIPLSCTSEERIQRACRKFFRENPDPVCPGAPEEPARANLGLIGDLLGLDAVERAVLQFIAALSEDSEFNKFVAHAGEYAMAQAHTLVAMCTGQPESDVRRVLSPSARLISSGLVTLQERACSLDDRFSFKQGMGDLLTMPSLTADVFTRHFLPEAKTTHLAVADFAHMHAEVSTLRAILGAAVQRRQRGVNVLLVGPTGTGKSALASLIAQELGVRLHTAGVADSDGDAASPRERLSSLLLGQRLFGGGDGILLFDEFEDLFQRSFASMFGGSGASTAVMSKLWFNLLLEDNPAPTVWISNSVQGVDPAFLRRFAYVVEFRAAGPKERARVLSRHLTDSEVTPDEVALLARRYESSPAQIATAVMAAGLITESGRPDRAALERVLEPLNKLVHGEKSTSREDFDPGPFRLDGVRAKADMPAIAERLSTWKETNGVGVSLCLYGPPGTGKTEYARFLAYRAGRPIVYRRGSDLLSMWVGGTEKAIAAAFREAQSEGALLVFDEVDTFLRNRENARASWEVTQVNEFLQQLEAFRGMVVCTTNLLHELDPAALRRFVFKVEFAYAGPSEARVLFDTLLAGCLDAPLTESNEAHLTRELTRMRSLAPGDFAAVARRIRAMGGRASLAELLAELAEEVSVKRAPKGAAGFA